MVCAVDHLAAGAGIAMLRAGGSAADAAVAANAVLTVTTQHMCGMGGDLFALVSEDGRVPTCLNASGRSGSGADAARLRSEGHATMPFRSDIRTVPVPGCVDGWIALHERYGRLPLADVLAPAIDCAREGFPASPTLAAMTPLIAALPGAANYSSPIRPGTTIWRPGVARALEAIVAKGRSGFYEGEFGEGLLTLGAGEYAIDDLARPDAEWVAPLSLDAWDRTLWTVPPNSQGYLTLASAWIASGLDLPDPEDPVWAHLLIEAARHAAFDRDIVLHEHADGNALLAEERLAPRRANIDRAEAAALPDAYRAGGTMFLCAVDDDRMGVSLIQSNASGFGAHIVEPATGIFLQNRGLGFSLEAGHPAEYGPRRRPPHTLSPGLVTSAGHRLRSTIGTMGGDSQPQILLQLLARTLGAGQSPSTAIGAGRWSLLTAGGPGSGFDTWQERGRVRVMLESTAPNAWPDALASMGHDVMTAEYGRAFGHAHLITVEDDHLAGAADPRALSGAAAAW